MSFCRRLACLAMLSITPWLFSQTQHKRLPRIDAGRSAPMQRLQKASPQSSGGLQTVTLAGGPTRLQDNSGNPGFANSQSAVSDGTGGYFIAASEANVVYHLSASGALSLVAGTGVASDAAAVEGLATRLSFLYPLSLALDTSGNLYIADESLIRVVEPSGETYLLDQTSGTYGFLSTAMVFDSSGNLYVSEDYDYASNAYDVIVRIDPEGDETVVAGGSPAVCSSTHSVVGDGCAAINATLPAYGSYGMALYGSTLYIADQDHDEIRAINLKSGAISDIAGTANVCGFSGDGGSATKAQLCYPTGVAVDGSGNVYFYDSKNARIRFVNTSTNVISTLAGNGTAGYSGDGGTPLSASLNSTAFTGIFPVSPTQFSFLDSYNNRIRQVKNGVIQTVAGTGNANFGGDAEGATLSFLDHPDAVVTDAGGDVYIADNGNGRVRRIDALTGVIHTVAGDPDGSYGDGGPATKALLHPSQLALDSTGNLFLADTNSGAVRRVDAATGVITTSAKGITYPTGIAITGNGTLLVADADACVVWQFSENGTKSVYAGVANSCGYTGEGKATSAELNIPSGIALDETGNLYIADLGNSRVREVTASGTMSTVAGNGDYGMPQTGPVTSSTALENPSGLSYRSGILYVADDGARLVYDIHLSSKYLEVVAGTGYDGYGVPATAVDTTLTAPGDVWPDGYGNLYITDYENNALIRVLNQPLAPELKLAASSTSFMPGASATLTASIAVAQFGTYATGKVSFSTNGETIGTVAVVNGVATLTATTSGIPAGVYSVIATYSGDSNYAAGSSNTVIVSVGVKTSTSLTATPVVAQAGSTVTLSAAVTDENGQAVTNGSVAFYAAGQLLGQGALASGQFVFRASTAGVPKRHLQRRCGIWR